MAIEKTNRINALFDFYEPLLTPKQMTYIGLYYRDDYSLGEIAEKPGTMGKLTYGPVFIPEGFDRVMNDLKDEELGTTHREKAFLELLKII